MKLSLALFSSVAFACVDPPMQTPPTPPAAGFADFKLSSDAKQYFISNSTGVDTNLGTEKEKPLKTLKAAYSKLISGKPDQILLKRGDTWAEPFPYWGKSGRSVDEPMLIGAYGVGERPTVDGDNALVTRSPMSFIAVQSIHFTNSKRNPASPNFVKGLTSDAAIRWQSAGESLFLEDNLIEFARVGIVSEQPANADESCKSYFKNLTLHRNIVANNWATPDQGHSQGMYAQCVDGLTMEENYFDANGYYDGIVGATRTVFNHDVYVNAKTKNVVAKGNIFSRASATGIQMRAGGVFEGNLVVQNPIGVTFGIVYGGTDPKNPHVVPGGVVGSVKGNTFLEGVDIDAANPRASALNLGNLKDVTVEGNVFAHYQHLDPKKPYNNSSVAVDCGNGVGLLKLTLKDNSMWAWAPWFITSGACKAKAVESGTVLNKAMDKMLSDYAPDFFAKARLQSRFNWDEKYTAAGVGKFIRANFAK